MLLGYFEVHASGRRRCAQREKGIEHHPYLITVNTFEVEKLTNEKIEQQTGNGSSRKMNGKNGHDPDVVVLGAGLGGLAAGVGLARQGWKVTIVEKELRHGSVWGIL